MRDKEKKRRLKRNPVFWCFFASFFLSLIILAVLSIESDLEENAINILLEILRDSAFFFTFSSVFMFITCVISMIHCPDLTVFLQIVIFFISAIYGVLIIFYDLFMVTIAGGNG
jgi:hypothetical protein